MIARQRKRKFVATPVTRWVYLAEQTVGDCTFFKIGVSGNPQKRIESISASGRCDVRLVARMPGMETDEKMLHKHFEKFRTRGEWFRNAGEIVEVFMSRGAEFVAVEAGDKTLAPAPLPPTTPPSGQVVYCRRNHGGGWNKGKAVGKKRPFTPEQIGQIRYALKAREDRFGLALFETALSTLLRSVDLLSLTVGDVVSRGEIVGEFSIMQRKTGKAHKVELSNAARTAIKDLLEMDDALASLPPGRPLWLAKGRKLKRLRYSNLVKEWARLAHLDPKSYSTHSLRRTMAAHVFKQTNNAEVVRNLLGQKSVQATSEYLDVSLDDALAVKRRFEI